jgi:hypothetical protein
MHRVKGGGERTEGIPKENVRDLTAHVGRILYSNVIKVKINKA